MPPRKTAVSGNPAKRAAAKKTTSDRRLPAADLTIAAEPRKKVSIDLVGVRYLIMPPKASLAVSITQQARNEDEAQEAFAHLKDWMEAAFGTAGAKKVQTRLDDKDDELDLHHIMRLMNALLELGGENPTT